MTDDRNPQILPSREPTSIRDTGEGAGMRELIARLEAATGPDRDLDRDICRLAVSKKYGFDTLEDWPEYTSSIDAALTLVPAHYCWQLKQGIGCEAIVWSITIDYDDDGAPAGYSTIFPAIALLIAIFKARLSLPPSNTKAAGE